jgi:hypothetical protein
LFTFKEVGFQDRELSLQVRVCWELLFGALGIRYRALRLLVQLVVEALKGKWGSQRTVEKRRGTHPGVVQACAE